MDTDRFQVSGEDDWAARAQRLSWVLPVGSMTKGLGFLGAYGMQLEVEAFR